MPSPEFGWSDAAPASGPTPRWVSSATTVPHRRPPASTNGTCRPPRRVHVRWIGHAWEPHRTFHCQWYIKYQIHHSRNDQPARRTRSGSPDGAKSGIPVRPGPRHDVADEWPEFLERHVGVVHVERRLVIVLRELRGQVEVWVTPVLLAGVTITPQEGPA